MSSHREQVLQAVKALFASALPAATVERNGETRREVEPGGWANIHDGDPGEASVDLSPLAYHYDHLIPVELAGWISRTLSPEEVLDEMLTAVGGAVAADRTLGGLVDWLDVQAPETGGLNAPGAREGRTADLLLTASYATPNPLI